jgi:hypothetical protein
VATDQFSHVEVDERAKAPPAIENELPTYRAISARAVFSLICGVLASFSFAHWFFLVFAVLAVVFGILANVAIKRHPDMLTGRGLANAGAAMGLVFGLVVSTYGAVHDFILTREASRFGKYYAKLLEQDSFGDILMYNLHPEIRKTKNTQQVLTEYETAKAKEKMMIEQQTAPLMHLRKRLASSKQEHVRFIDIETHGVDDTRAGEISYYALALFEVEGPANKDFPNKTQYAMAFLRGRPKGRHYDWWVEDVKFPYQPRSFAPPTKAVDDGHGHAH